MWSLLSGKLTVFPGGDRVGTMKSRRRGPRVRDTFALFSMDFNEAACLSLFFQRLEYFFLLREHEGKT